MTREEAINILGEVKELDDSIYQYNFKYLEALDMAIKALEQEPILDKIRADIEEYIDCMRWDDSESFIKLAAINYVLKLIDKYKAESEVKK